jgi:phosphatidylethanolamine/phosphatidyl-N-methylethanolamine N-methyltransferase
MKNKNAGLMFLTQWLKSPLTVASVTPSSEQLARAMAKCVPEGDGLVIELGGGTGPVTHALRQRMVNPADLVVVERDPQFYHFLHKRFPDITLVCGDAFQTVELTRHLLKTPVRAVVSGLPLLSMSGSQQKRLVEQALALTQGKGPLIQFSYGFSSPVKKEVHRQLGLTATCAAQVWRNVPPARVWVYHGLSLTSSRSRTPALADNHKG